MKNTDPAPKNRAAWNASSDEYQSTHARTLDAAPEAWGVWRIGEDELGVLGELDGRDVLELGCGAAQWSIALARRGLSPVAFDLSDRQLGHARSQRAAAGVDFPLVQATAESLPFAARSFDVVFCDHGAMSFARPEPTVAEVARVLRPGGLFAFCHASPLLELCWDESAEIVDERLHTSYFDLYEIADGAKVSYQLPYGEWIRLFRRHGFLVEDLTEPRPPADAETSFGEFASLQWARRWPAECLWRLRLGDGS